MDLGFRRAPSSAPLSKPVPPVYADVEDTPAAPGAAGKTIRLVGAVTASKRPQLRPRSEVVLVATATAPDATSVVSNSDITAALREAVQTAPTPPATASTATPEAKEAEVVIAKAQASARPEPRPQDVTLAVQQAVEQEIVTRVSTSGGRHWGVNVGRFPSRYAAEKVLLKTALAEMSTLDGTLRKVVQRPQGYDANFLGMSRESADLACRRLAARNVSCFMIGPSEG